MTVGFCWYAYSEKASGKMADSSVLRKYVTSPMRDFMHSYSWFPLRILLKQSLFSPGWPHICSPNASASLMFRLHGAPVCSIPGRILMPRAWVAFSSQRDGPISCEACRNEESSDSLPSALIGHPQVHIQPALAYMLGVSVCPPSVSVFSETWFQHTVVLSLVITCKLCLAFES